MFLALLVILALSNDSLLVTAAFTATPPVRIPRVPRGTIVNANGGILNSPAKPVMPDINLLVDHAEFALNSYLPSAEILKTLRRTKTNVRIIQRHLDNVGASYNIIQYSDKTTEDVRWVVSIPGSRNNKNMQQNMDNKLVLDDVLNIKVHRYGLAHRQSQACHYLDSSDCSVIFTPLFIPSMSNLNFVFH